MRIPSVTVRIGDGTFRCCKRLTALKLPSGVRSIGDSVFHGCDGLKRLTIPTGVKTIGADCLPGECEVVSPANKPVALWTSSRARGVQPFWDAWRKEHPGRTLLKR